MIVLDTNVISEVTRRTPSPEVVAWIGRHSRELVTTTVTMWELLYGVERLPVGARRVELARDIERLFAAMPEVLVFDAAAARAAAVMRARREALGRPVRSADLQIAGICAANGAAVATRNVDDFDDLGIDVINPWVEGWG